ncbi:MAG: hypothetical protein EAY69_07470 [Cytophagales bacterium]|nr:MAG: hypothetical protein EAY69_07470 [Cytophagales bacterium]
MRAIFNSILHFCRTGCQWSYIVLLSQYKKSYQLTINK